MSDMKPHGSGRESYWAAADIEDLPREMQDQIRRYYEHLDSTGRLELWQRANRLYYGQDAEGTWVNSAAVTYGGDQGEVALLRANHFRSLLDHVLALVTGTRPTMIARAINADAQSQAQAKLADGLLDFYMDEKGLEDHAVKALSYLLRFGEGWVYEGWDENEGDPVSVDTETMRPVFQGDLVAETLHPIDVIRDVAHDGHRGLAWVITHHRANRWDLIAEYPEAEEAIRNAPAVPDLGSRDMWSTTQRHSDDEVSVYRLHHKRSPAMPEGRYAMLCGEVLLWDGPLPYEKLPVIPAAPDVELRTPFGYTTSWDLMSLQAALDSCLSVAVSNHEAFGLQHVWTQKGSGLDVHQMSGGLRHWESNTKPEPIQLTKISEDTYKLIELLQSQQQTLIGVNDVARGNPDPNVKSGAMAALIHSMAVQYNNGLQRAYGGLLERMGTHAVQVLQKYASTPRLADISGVRGRPLLKEFTGEDINAVRRVTVDLGNAIMRTTAGRQDIADKLLERQMIENPQQYLEVIATGRLEPLTQRYETQRRGIDSENERLIVGEGARVMITDDHKRHIDEHLSLLDEPTIRDNDDISAVILDHIQLHIEQWQQITMGNPGLLAAIGTPPFPMPMGAPPADPGAMNPGAGGGGGNPGPISQAMTPPGTPVGATPAPEMPNAQAAQMPSMPAMPGNEEEPYNPDAGVPV